MGLKQLKGNAPDGGYIIEGDIHISYRALEAFYLSAIGLDNKEASEHMGIGVNTYRNHVYSVMKKLGAGNRANALLIAIENGMFEVSNHHFLLGWSPEDWILCWKCNRAFPKEEINFVEKEPFKVDHVWIEPWPEKMCPYKGCGASVWEGWEWSEVREANPEFPEIPEKNREYEIAWQSQRVKEFIEKERNEHDGR